MDNDKLKHCVSVARKMVEIGKEHGLGEEELQDLFVLGFNHDIGYEFGEYLNHEQRGGEVLKRNGFKYWQEVYHHGDINSKYDSLFLKILIQADMQVDKYGNDVGYEKRLEDIMSRYGEGSTEYQNAKILVEKYR
ncbi:MAG: HD domain-containing protein [Clostridia bacterium]|nr:HD domain-containing protein [Clostridia bacterium]